MLRPRTFMAKHEAVSRQWHLIDAKDQILGRLATQVAALLRGKGKAIFTPHVDCGDGVIVINADKVQVTGTKLDTKIYKTFSGYPSGLKQEPLRRLIVRRPTEVLRRAVVGMLPKNPLGRKVAKHLRIYTGTHHPHASQLAGSSAK